MTENSQIKFKSRVPHFNIILTPSNFLFLTVKKKKIKTKNL